MTASLFYNADKRITIVIYIGLAVQLITAFFSVGYHHPDEHWQLLEFANFKLGLSSVDQLPWEYAAKSRSCFQPLIVYMLGKLMMALGVYNPVHLAFILRLLSSMLAWFCSLLLIKYAEEKIFTSLSKSDAKQNKNFLHSDNAVFVLTCVALLTWFAPYIHCRFSGENWGGIFFFIGLIISLHNIGSNKKATQNALWAFVAGIIFGVAYLCRFQIAFAAVGFGLWLVIFGKMKISTCLALVFGGICVVLLGFVIDFWYFGVWTSTAYNYYHAQIISNVAASWGETPWWDYFAIFTVSAAPPLSIIYLIFIALSLYTHPKHPFTWVLIFFVGGHMMVGHKEERFLFPMVYLMPLMVTLWMASTRVRFMQNENHQIIKKIVLVLIIVLNTALLITVMLFKPANESASFYNYVYSVSDKKPVTIFTLDVNPYKFGSLDNNFYKPADLKVIKIDSIAQMTNYARKNNETIYFFDNHFTLSENIELRKPKLIPTYRTIPEWISHFNFNNWLVRARVWSLYKLE